MGSLARDMVEAVRSQFGFAASSDEVLGWLNMRHRKAVARSECLTETLDLGVTDGSDVIELPERVLRLRELTIGRVPYERTGRAEIRMLRSGRAWLSGDGGVFAPDAGAAGDDRIVLFPTPDAGLEVRGFASVRAGELGMEDELATPEEFDDELADGVAAVGLKREPEQLNVAVALEREFDMGVEELRQQVRRRLRSGPRRIRVVWP
ncbi:MAG: hypothetical protein IRZ28_17185 [Steroidobacteraceae bacterium]|nr:hypothetical protein [Steroidobacteraceae bacterium]